MMTPSPKAPGLWRGISCNEIDKYPVADEKRCIGFGRCFLTCGKEVYQVDWDKKISSRPPKPVPGRLQDLPPPLPV
jgi:hypothetical protein